MLLELPTDIVVSILSLLPLPDVISTSRVHSSLKQVAHSNELWGLLHHRDFGVPAKSATRSLLPPNTSCMSDYKDTYQRIHSIDPSSILKLIREGSIKQSIDIVVNILHETNGISPRTVTHTILNMSGIDEAHEVAEQFASLTSVRGRPFIDSFRAYLEKIAIPDSCEQLDVLIHGFATAFGLQNPHSLLETNNMGFLDGCDAANVLCYSAIMLSNELHHTPKQLQMLRSPQQFVAAYQGVCLSERVLLAIWSDVSKKPLPLDQPSKDEPREERQAQFVEAASLRPVTPCNSNQVVAPWNDLFAR